MSSTRRRNHIIQTKVEQGKKSEYRFWDKHIGGKHLTYAEIAVRTIERDPQHLLVGHKVIIDKLYGGYRDDNR